MSRIFFERVPGNAKHKRHKLIFDPNTLKLPDFLKKFNRDKKTSGENACTSYEQQPVRCKFITKTETIRQQGAIGNCHFAVAVTRS